MYIKRDYIYTAVLCAVITVLCCYAAYKVRGYFAVGGEWFAWMPVLVLGAAEDEEETWKK